MAVVWARTGGAWDSSIWDYWDGTQVTAYPYASPQSGDVVYLNNKSVTYNSTSISIGVGILSNDEYVDTNVSIARGGSLRITASNNFTFTGNIYAVATILTATFSAYNYAINVNGNIEAIGATLFNVINLANYAAQNTPSVTGNINLQNANLWNHTQTSKPWLINGIITGDTLSNIITGTTTSTGTINGTCSIGNANAITTLAINGNCNVPLSKFLSGTTCNISGDVTIGDAGYISFTTLNLNKVEGRLTIGHNARCSATNLLFNGDLIEYYDDSKGFCGVTWAVSGGFTITSDNFQWKNISSPRTSKYVIVTNYDLANRQQYPAVTDVKKDVEYAWGALVGTLESGVQVGCVTKEDVREGVPLIGMSEVGTLVVPSADDVREGVVFDNGSVGTLIVQGGGDRLRIADFGYYTNAQSDTYIVDLTEQDKPKFAVAEERVLIEMFPDLDLENIPEKYFDDLFVKYLKYRLIVEYYRTAGINSTFTPSEPTTEIVNYQNVRNEVWLNSANIYLKAWAKKYPESITKPQRILL